MLRCCRRDTKQAAVTFELVDGTHFSPILPRLERAGRDNVKLVFGRDEDKQVVGILKNAFPDRTIEIIDYNEVAQEGGLLNCTTWVVKKDYEAG